jgi:pyruvate-formate lyase-activating enzyme
MNEILARVHDLRPKYTIFMGQEAALDPELPKLAKAMHEKARSNNILLTNGLAATDLSHIDEVVFSFKAYNDAVHIQYTGLSNHQILINFRELLKTSVKIQAEIAYIPGLVEEDEIEALAKYVGALDPDLPFRVTSYFAVPGVPWRAADQAQVEKATSRAKLHLLNVMSITSDMKQSTWKPERIF